MRGRLRGALEVEAVLMGEGRGAGTDRNVLLMSAAVRTSPSMSLRR